MMILRRDDTSDYKKVSQVSNPNFKIIFIGTGEIDLQLNG